MYWYWFINFNLCTPPMQESEKWKWNHSVVWLLATPWTAAYQASPSMGFSTQEYWSGLPLPSLWIWLSNWELMHQKLEEVREESPLSCQREHSPSDILSSDFWTPEVSRNFLLFSAIWFLVLCDGSPQETNTNPKEPSCSNRLNLLRHAKPCPLIWHHPPIPISLISGGAWDLGCP